MQILDKIAEKRIEEAIERGDLDALPGQGKALQLDDDAGVPPELRTACRILKNAGVVPPEVSTRKQIAELKASIRATADNREARRAARRLSLLMTRLENSRGSHPGVEDLYYRYTAVKAAGSI